MLNKNILIFVFLFFEFIPASVLSQDISKNNIVFPYSQPIIDELLKNHVTISHQRQSDYGNIHQSTNYYFEAWPKSTAETAKLVKFAYVHDIPIRVQGNAHSENGHALAKQYELIIHTTYLNSIFFNKENFVTVGAGIPISIVKEKVEELSGYTIPIYNGGGIGPSVGGYISAGGLGDNSEQYGGFWEHVSDVTLVTGFGKILHINEHSPLFLWLFGSMGQFGVITEANLKLISNSVNLSLKYPHGQHLIVDYKKQLYTKPMYWFNLFVTDDRLKTATSDLEYLQNKYKNILNFVPMYHWKIKCIKKMPPLIFTSCVDFNAIGIWGSRNQNNMHDQDFFQLTNDFSKLVLKKHYKRYIQAEYVADNQQQYYEKYFGNKVYSQFKSIKAKLDPKFYFDRGNVF
jgi:hypothetical protein